MITKFENKKKKVAFLKDESSVWHPPQNRISDSQNRMEMKIQN